MVGHECGFRLGQLLVCGRERASSAGGPREPGVCRAGTPRGADPGRRQLRLYFQRPVTLAFPRVLETFWLSLILLRRTLISYFCCLNFSCRSNFSASRS